MTENLPRRPATWSGRAALINQTLQDATPADQKIHALVDCAHRTTLSARLAASGLPHMALFEPVEGAPPAAVAPYLLELPGQHDVGMLLAEGFGQSWFSYLCSDRPLDVLAAHLRDIVQSHAATPTRRGSAPWLALWDPREAVEWLSGLRGAAAVQFFDGIGALYASTRGCDGQLLRFSLRGDTVANDIVRLWSDLPAD